MRSAPIKRLFRTVRLMVDPSIYGDQPIFHYSLPLWHETGDGAVERASDLNSGKLLLSGNEILVSKLNPEKGAVIHAQPNELPILCSPEMIPLIAEDIHPRYAYYLMLSQPVREQLLASVESVTNSHKRARVDRFLSSRVRLPTNDMQKLIADFLDRETARIDQLIEKKQRMVELIKEGETAQISRQFEQIDAPVWRLRHLGKVRNGAGFPVDRQGDASQEIAFFKVKHLKVYGLDASLSETSDTVSRETARALRATVFPPGTIVFAKIGAALLLGRFSMLGRPACIDNNMAAFIPNERLLDPDFALLGLSQADMRTMVQPGAVPSLSTEALYNFAIPLPSIEVQQEFVRKLRSRRAWADQIVAKAERSISGLREYRSSLVTAAVTGQIDVRSWESRDSVDPRLRSIEEGMSA